jgi:hypothetical protein
MHLLVNRAATVALVVSIAACSAGPDGSPAASSNSPASGAAAFNANAPPEEAVRVQAYLDSRYLRTDVRHQFKSALGDDIDCVDVAREPGVRRLLARGLTLDEILGDDGLTDEMREHNKTAKYNDAYFAGDLDEQGRTRACPAGTVPHVRVTPERIAAAGGLDAFTKSRRKAPPPRATPPGAGGEQPPDVTFTDYQWVTSTFWAANTGGTSTMTIAQPWIANVGDHSLEQTWTFAGTGLGTQTLEIGWTVDYALNGDLNPHLFTYSTKSDYSERLDCYDGYPDSDCPTWIPANSSLAPGGTLSAYISVGGGVGGGTRQHELTVTTGYHRDGLCSGGPFPHCTYFQADGWGFWVSVDGGPTQFLGYYPFSDYGGGALSGGRADGFEMGAEACDTTRVFTQYSPNVQIGEGSLGYHATPLYTFVPNDFPGNAAYQRNFAYFGTDSFGGGSGSSISTGNTAPENFVGTDTGSTMCTSNCVYVAGASFNEAPENPTWTNWFYFADATPSYF